MASLHAGGFNIEYSIVTGKPREFKYGQLVLIDEKGFHGGWQEWMKKLVKDFELDKEKGAGLPAFVYWMKDEGLLPEGDA